MSTPYPGLNAGAVELQTIFEQCIGKRGTQSQRWEDYAGWTLPALYPSSGIESGDEAQHDYQALGAQAVNHLANKIVMTLFAPSRPFFKLELTPVQSAQLQEAGLSLADIEALTASVENQSMRSMEKVHLRTSVIQAIKNLIVLGNTLMFFPGKGEHSQVYNMHDYVIRRDAGGTVLQIVTRDRRAVTTLPQAEMEAVLLQGLLPEDEVEIYTGITRTAENKYFVKQEINDLIVTSGKKGIYTESDLPWLPLTWNLIRGQDYGTGLVEEYAGDFHVYSSLSEANLNIASIAADIKILVNPMGQTDVTSLNESASGTFVYGHADDVSYLQLEKLGDFQFVEKIMDQYGRRIGAAFLLNTQVTRDAERVTAEEIRLQANELESSLGGVYSRLAEEMQQPLARMLVKVVNSKLGDIEPVILTGVESLSRNSEHEQMMLFFNDLTLLGNIPEQMQGDLKFRDIAILLAANRGIEYDKFLKTADEKKADQQEAQKQAQQQMVAEGAAKGAGQAMASQPR